MSEKMFNTRIQHKHDVEVNWLKAVNFVPKAGELIVYDPDENFSYARTKMGDGLTGVNDLPFVQVQSDWNQSDETAADYIKNRTHYEEVIEESIEGLTFDFILNYGNPFKHGYNIPFELGQIWELTYNGGQKMQFPVEQAEDGSLYIGDSDSRAYLYITKDTAKFSQTLIWSDPNQLTGVSGKITGESIVHQLDEKYIPTATDDEIIALLAQEDMLPVVADSDGSLLADENENILLW